MEGKKIVGHKTLKKTIKGKLKKECNKEEKRMRMIKDLMNQTKLTEEEVLDAEKEFLLRYPGGGVTKQEFIELSSQGFISESLFRAFDKVPHNLDDYPRRKS